jgi:hypothetical protein
MEALKAWERLSAFSLGDPETASRPKKSPPGRLKQQLEEPRRARESKAGTPYSLGEANTIGVKSLTTVFGMGTGVSSLL